MGNSGSYLEFVTSDDPLFIVNPASGRGRTRRRWPALAKAIEAAGLAAEAAHTEAPGHGIELAAEALAGGRRKLIAVGGDGTVNEVATAVLAAGAGDDVQIGTIAMGQGKNIARCLGTGGPRVAIRAIVDGSERQIDAGRVICRDGEGESTVRFFVLVAAAGWAAEIAADKIRFPKPLGETAPYLLTLMRKLVGPTGRNFTLTIDAAAYDGRYNSISVHNMESWGGNLVAAPDAKPDDGQFDVIRWGARGRLSELKALHGQRKGGTHLATDGVDRHIGHTLEVDADKKTVVGLDGEIAGYLPARITLLDSALRFVTP